MDTQILVALIGVGGVVLTIAGTLGGTYLGTILNRSNTLKTALEMAEVDRHKYTQDRLWDVRKESYTAIIAGLRATARLAAIVDDGFHGGQWHPEEYHASDASSKQISELWNRWRETKTEFENARLLLSEAFVARFEQLEADISGVDDDEIPPMVYDQCEAIFREAVPEVLAIAKAEIAPQLPAHR